MQLTSNRSLVVLSYLLREINHYYEQTQLLLLRAVNIYKMEVNLAYVNNRYSCHDIARFISVIISVINLYNAGTSTGKISTFYNIFMIW